MANKLIDQVENITGIDIKSFDNIYHRGEKVNSTPFHKYSKEAALLLEKIRDGADFELHPSAAQK